MEMIQAIILEISANLTDDNTTGLSEFFFKFFPASSFWIYF